MQIDFLGSNIGVGLAKKISLAWIEEYEIALRKFSKIATRETIDGLFSDLDVGVSQLNVKVLAPVTLLYIEFGRRAGAKMPPEGSLDKWYEAKGIDKKYDFVIRRAIARRGIKPTPITETVLQAVRPRFEAIYQEFMTVDMVKVLTTRLTAIYKNG